MDRTLLPPVGVAEHTPLPPVGQPLPSVTDSPAVITTLPPYNVDSGRYGPCSLLALQFSSADSQPLAGGIPGTAGPTQVQRDLAPSHGTSQSGERTGKRRRRRRRRTVVTSSMSQVRMQTLMVYQEYPPVLSPPRPYSPLVGAFHPEFSPLRGTCVSPPDSPTPHFPPPALQRQVGQPRPVLTQFYAVTDPPSHPLPSRQPSLSGLMDTPSSGIEMFDELPSAPSHQKHRRSTSLFAAPSATQARLLNMAATYSPVLGGFVAVPHSNDAQCFYSPYSVEMPPLVSSTHQPYCEPSTRATNVDTQMDASQGMAWMGEFRTDHIPAEADSAFGPPFSPAFEGPLQGGDGPQPTTPSLPTPLPLVPCGATSVATEHGGSGREGDGVRRQPALPPSAEASSPKRARRGEPPSRTPHGEQREECILSSVVHESPLPAAHPGQESSAEVVLSTLPRKRTRSGQVGQLPPKVQPRKAGGCTATSGSPSSASGGPSSASGGPSSASGGPSSASGDPCALGQGRGREEGVDIIDALRRCSFPSTQFSTLLQVRTYIHTYVCACVRVVRVVLMLSES